MISFLEKFKKKKTWKRKSQKLACKWTNEEIELYTEILSDPDSGFAQSLERLALKKSSNNKVFRHIHITQDKSDLTMASFSPSRIS